MPVDLSLGDLTISGQPRQALQAFATQAINHPEVEGVLLYGSALWKSQPADLDFVIMLAKTEYVHFYGVHSTLGMRCEVEYITAPVLEDYVKYPHWRVADWELDVGAKYVQGRILSDKQGRFGDFRQRLDGPEGLRVRRYLFVHQIGQANSRLNKLATRSASFTEPDVFGLTADFAHALDAAAHNAHLTYPRRGHTLEGLTLTTLQFAAMVAPGQTELKRDLLKQVTTEGITNLDLKDFLADCPSIESVLAKLPIYHLVDYNGLELVLKEVRPDLQLPTDLMMPWFNA